MATLHRSNCSPAAGAVASLPHSVRGAATVAGATGRRRAERYAGRRVLRQLGIGVAALYTVAACANEAPVAPAEGSAAALAGVERGAELARRGVNAPDDAPADERASACAEPVAARSRLERTAAGLLYTSEADYPFDWVFWCDGAARSAHPVAAADLRRLAAIDSSVDVVPQSLDEFFARHIERADPNDAIARSLVPRYRRLKRVLATTLRDVRVYRVGEIAIRCYIVGRDVHGNVIGLSTTSVET